MNEVIPDMTKEEAVIYCYDNMPTVYSQIKDYHTAQDIFYMMYLYRISQGQKAQIRTPDDCRGIE